ncbi:hypothetical protein L7F22_067998 [Adiantum nelumboides]|nr:hypothetical protein [Adiantum nelumboides]
MNLPRHSITSHAVTPIFNNAHFATIYRHDDEKSKYAAEQKSQDRQKIKREGKQSFGLSRNISSGHTSTASFDSKASSSRPSSSSSSTPNKATKDEEKQKRIKSKIESNDNETIQSNGNMFACATNDGFFIARTEPFRIVAHRKFTALQGGLSHVALIDDSSLVVLVGGGRVPRFAPNKVILWDENAEYKVPIISSKGNNLGAEDDDAISEGTASPPPSTIFSLGREQSESRTEDQDADDDDESIVNEEGASRSTLEMSKTSNAIASGVLPAMLDDKVLTESRPKLEDEEEGIMSSSQIFGDIEDDESEGMGDDALKGSLSASIAQSESEKSIISTATDEPIIPLDNLSADMSKSDEEMSTFSAAERDFNSIHDDPLEKSETQHKIERGREVAELEFGEAVQSIRVESFCRSETSNSDLTGEEANEHTSSKVEAEKVRILVVILQTKAVIFEMGTHLHNNSVEEKVQQSTKSQWGIRQRFVLDIHPDSNRCTAALSQIEKTNCALIALPGRQIGHVQLVCVEFSYTKRTSIHSSMAGASTIIAAHTNVIACLELSKDGRYLCTASDRGTILRFWSTVSAGKSSRSSNQRVTGNNDRVKTMAAALLGELRRGSESARILSIAITPDNRFLAVASDKGTIHFFNLDALQHGIPLISGNGDDSETSLRRFSPSQSTQQSGFKLSQKANRFLPNAIQNFAQQIPTSLLPQYFKSQWSFAQFRIRLQVFSGRMIDGMRHVKPPPEKRKTHSSIDQKGKGRQGQGMDDDDEDFEREKSFIGDAFVPDRARNLEGGWAHMRGRVNDIRKGERTIQEGIWLDWVFAKQFSEKEDENFQLIAITSSGGLYRIAISTKRSANPSNTTSDNDRQDSSSTASSSTILDMYRSDTSDSLSKSSIDAADIGSCTLVEHFRFGKRDEWLE